MSAKKYDEKKILSIMNAMNGIGSINTAVTLKELALNYSTFNKIIEKLSESYPEEYNRYVSEKETNLKSFVKSRKELILLIEDMICNGVVKDDGSVRDFDIIDWYYIYNRYFEKVNRKFMSKLFDELDKENPNNRPFLTRRMVSSSFNDTLKPFVYIFEKDIINDSSYGLTDIEKEAIITHFYQNNIPFNDSTFNCAAKRVINNRKNSKYIDYDMVNGSNNLDFVKDDVIKFHQLNVVNECFKINKRIR